MADAQNTDDETDDISGFADDVVELPIDGVLDLHGFAPAEVKQLVPDYLDECRVRDILDVRIIHGKGTGVLRRIVQSALERIDFVESYHLGDHGGGSWGATVVRLHPKVSS